MKNNINIEDLFKNTLSNAEANPPAGAWEAIQAKMGVTAASTATGAAATGLGIGKIAAIVVTALGVGLGAGYLAFKGSSTSKNTSTPQEQNISDNNTSLSENTTTLPKDVTITEVSSVHTADKMVSIVEVKKGEETRKIRVEIHQPSTENNNGSIVNQWLSPNKDKINRQAVLQRIMTELEKDDSGETNSETPVQKNNNLPTEETTREKVQAVIVSVTKNENPLTVNFSNLSAANSYEWDFGDNTTSTESNPEHTYSQPGIKVVSLKVTDKAGKIYTDKVPLEVLAKEETTLEISSVDKPNVFTPNGDGKTDEFFITGKNIESFMITIMDAGNKVLFTSTDIEQRWNGNDKAGNPVANGKYYYAYKAVGKDKKVHEYAGIIVVNR